MAGKATTKAPAKAPTKQADQAAPAAAAATAEQLDNQPAGPTDGAGQTAAGGTDQAKGATRSDAGTSGQDAQPIVIWNGKGVAEYIEALKAGDEGVIPLQDLGPATLRRIAEFVGVEDEQLELLPFEQLIPWIEEKAGIEASAPAKAGDQSEPGATGDDADEIQALFIRSVSPRGFRRCGHRFTPEGHGIAMDALSQAQIETLLEDPNLRVELCGFTGEPE